MTNELEKTFFNTFGIEPDITSCYHNCKKDLNCKECNEAKVIYPQITDHILLELICILGNTSYFLITDDGLPIDVDGLKKSVIHSLTLQAKVDKNKVLKHKVRTLF